MRWQLSADSSAAPSSSCSTRAIEARVVSEVAGAIGRMRFVHALIRDAAYHRLTRSRRVQLHRQVGEALEALYSSDLDAHLAELAHHFFESAAGGDGQKAVDYARRAGSRAVALLAYEEAARLYEMALEALGPDAAATARLRCELLLALADAQGRAGDEPGGEVDLPARGRPRTLGASCPRCSPARPPATGEGSCGRTP